MDDSNRLELHENSQVTDVNAANFENSPLPSVDQEVSAQHHSCEPQKVDVILKKPEFTFLAKCYCLMYQSLIPNSNLTISILKKHLPIPADTESFIFYGNQRTRCQRIMNLLLVNLDIERDYKQFCYLFSAISVLTDLPHKLMGEFQANSKWDRNLTCTVHSRPDLIKQHHQVSQNILSTRPSITGDHMHPYSDYNDCAVNLSASGNTEQLDNHFVGIFTAHFIINDEASDDRADKCSINSHYLTNGRRYSAVKQSHPSSSIVSATNGHVSSENHLLHSCSTPGPSSISPTTDDTGVGDVTEDMQLIRSRFDDILQALPTDYEKTLQVMQDHLTDEQMCHILSSSNYSAANKAILDCLITNLGSVSDFCDQLERLLPLLTNPTVLEIIINDLRTSVKPQGSTAIENTLPQKLILIEDFVLLKPFYNTILQMMPKDYELTTGKLQHYITDDQVCVILSSSKPAAANKIILDGLIERMTYKEELLDLCDQLELIATSQNFKTLIGEIRAVLQQDIQFPSSGVDYTGTQSSLNDQQLDAILKNTNGAFYEETFSEITSHTDSKVIAVLKKNYTKLWHCLPRDYIKTIAAIKRLLRVEDNFLDPLTMLPTADLANEGIISTLIILLQSDTLTLCDIVRSLSEDASSTTVNEIRNEILGALSSPLDHEHMVTTNPAESQTSTGSASSDNTITGLLCNTNTVLPSVRAEETFSTNSRRLPVPAQDVSSKAELQEQLKYKEKRLHKGLKYQQAPPLPTNYVSRQALLNEIATKLCQAPIDPNTYGTTLTITGAGGFGKTTVVTALCHQSVLKQYFTDGFLFVELGPQATDPSIKLSQLYHLLTDQYLKQSDINYAEQEIKLLTSAYCRNLLIVIDDVWYVEDAEPFVKAFSHCKIILTTRMNDFEQFIPTKESMRVGPMEQSESVSLLTYKIIDTSRLSQGDLSLLIEVAQDVHLWPLLLCLVRGHLSHSLKQHRLHDAITNVQAKLHEKGLTAFDKNIIESVHRSRNYAVKICIEVTLELLTESLSDKIKSLILWTGIGTSMQTTVLSDLWNTSKQEASDVVHTLWGYGLVQYTEIAIPPKYSKQHFVEVHAVICQYIVESMESKEVNALSPYIQLGTAQSVGTAMARSFIKSYGVQNPSSLSAVDLLKYRSSIIENTEIPFLLKAVNMYTIVDPHCIIQVLLNLQEMLMSSPYANLTFLHEEIKSLIDNCHNILKSAHKLSRKLNQNVQRCLHENKHEQLIQVIEEYVEGYPICKVAQKADAVVGKIIPYCNEESLHYVLKQSEEFQITKPDNHLIKTWILPRMKLFIKLHKQISNSLLTGTPKIESTCQYIKSGEFNKELKLVNASLLTKLQQIASST